MCLESHSRNQLKQPYQYGAEQGGQTRQVSLASEWPLADLKYIIQFKLLPYVPGTYWGNYMTNDSTASRYFALS